jgi:imidazolonepropionase-like amidohydrolase
MLAIKGGKVLTITNGVIDDGVILIEKGKIKAIGGM